MVYNEAIKYIGQTVFCTTNLWGAYLGTLLDIIPSKPWRGNVSILSVIEYPDKIYRTNGSLIDRKPFKKDHIQNFGAASIYKFLGDVVSYENSVWFSIENALEKIRRSTF